jgi:hypothetical protein
MDTYRSLLDYLVRSDTGMWISTPNEINLWWRQRSRMNLTRHNGRWRIDGPGSERALVAFAKLEGDKLVYTVTP